MPWRNVGLTGETGGIKDGPCLKCARFYFGMSRRHWGCEECPTRGLETEIRTLEWLRVASDEETVGQLRTASTAGTPEGIDPEQFWDLETELPYDVQIGWSQNSTDGGYDVVFLRRTGGARPLVRRTSRTELRSWNSYANDPLRGKLRGYLTPKLRDFVQASLPAYMIPSAFVPLEVLPLTPNGKLDRRALPAPDPLRSDQGHVYVAPRNHLEQQIADIWKDVLGLEQVGIHDNFFDLGGHSLLATQVVSRLRTTFNIELPLRSLFEAPTIKTLLEIDYEIK